MSYEEELKVPIKKGDKTILEDWNQDGKQSDGSQWTKPVPLIPPDHEHYFVLSPQERHASCECGMGGYVYPHNAVYKDGHIYKLDGKKVI